MSAASANTRSVGQLRGPCQAESSASHSITIRYDPGVPLNVWGFAAVTVPLVATPGASTAVVLRNSLAGGVRSGVATAIGANTGSICYGVLTAFGVAVVLQRWPLVWLVLRVLGTAYLAWLGLRSLRMAWTYRQGDARTAAVAARPPLARSLREGFVTNVLNPSLATFYLLILPQFIPRGAPPVASALTLTALHVSLALTWHLTWAAAGGTLAETLGRTKPRRILEGISGAALLGLALKLALAR
jgi:threonine/homoserine/homoserine lactone efflux protein